MIAVNDIVRFLNSVGGGRVVRIAGNMAYVEDEDGFETPALVRECVVVGHHDPAASAAKQHAAPSSITNIHTGTAEVATPTPQPTPQEEPLEIEETPGGDKINLTLAFEPRDIKSPTTSPIDIFLVNDSNYYVSFIISTRSKDTDKWLCRHTSVVEPNIQLLLGELDRGQLPDMDRLSVQYIAYKQGKPYEMKQPASVDLAFDNTKFFKLHCYKPNVYFETPVIAIDLVHDDIIQSQHKVDPAKLENALKSKKATDINSRRPVVKRRQPKAELHGGNIVVDLHIQELVDNTRGLSNADMLNLQIDEFRRVMDAHLKKKGTTIVFIHGKGEGVLRNALMKELSHRYKGNDVQDASFREYGFGATQVTIK